MKVTLIGRVLLPIMVFFFAHAGLYQIPFLVENAEAAPWLVHGGILLCSAIVGGLMWSYTEWDGDIPGPGESALIGAIILGFIGFFGGFAGPIIFMPGANQGPLIGILFTGPLGCVAGAMVGYGYWRYKGSKGGQV